MSIMVPQEAWLRWLKQAFYDAEDLLDEHEYNLLKRKAERRKDPFVEEDETSSITSVIMKPLRDAKKKARNLLPRNRKLIDKMKEFKAILLEAKELRDLLGLLPGNTIKWPPVVEATIVPTTTSLPTSKVFGRDRDRDRIVDFLLGKTTTDMASSARYSGLAIVGTGGMGKSTLAQYVYNDKRVEEGFDVRMWVCISRRLDIHRHTREIIESAIKGECPRVHNLDTLQCKLSDILQESQKFFLVLDDVWFEKSDSETEWDQLLAPLVSKQSGSRVGRDYFNDIVSGSFFQELAFDNYIMHDILHDLAESLSREDCFRLEDDSVTEIPCTVRHLSVSVESMHRHKQIIYKLHHLRTVICIDPLMDNASVIFDQILQNMKKLRVLHLSFYNSSKLPESVGELKYLRYLDLTRTSVSELPRSLCVLYHLQLLQLNRRVERLPEKVCNLSKLRYLDGYMIPNIGKLTSLQQIYVFSVQKKQGYELHQLKNLNELGGWLTVKNLENVIGKDEALESKLYQKNRLKGLTLEWSYENGMDAMNIPHLDILEGLRPPPQLSELIIKGYNSDKYPGWLLERSYFENLECFELHNCSLLEGLPPDTELLRHCSRLHLWDVPKLKTLSCIPPSLTVLFICGCPLLTFVTKNQLEQHDLRENVMNADDLASKLALMWEVDSGSPIRSVLSQDYSSLKQLLTQNDDDISKHLQVIESAFEEGGDMISVIEDIIKAWLFCHEQRIRVIYRRTMELPLVLSSGLRTLYLSSCSITDEALAFCLGDLTELENLELTYNMALTALPSEEVFQHLTNLKELRVFGCWCLRSLGGLRAASSLSCLYCTDCPCLELSRGAGSMPLNLDVALSISGCILAADSFNNGLPHLKSLSISNSRSSPSLSIGHLTSLESLSLGGTTDLCFLEGLSSLQLKNLALVDVPNLTTKCNSQFCVHESLTVSSSALLDHMLRAEGFTVPPYLSLEYIKESSVSFEEPAKFSSVKQLNFRSCKMESLPTNLKFLFSLESLHIITCPNIASLPDLPSSLQHITIWGCDVLKKNCQEPDGESWPKISHIRSKNIG